MKTITSTRNKVKTNSNYIQPEQSNLKPKLLIKYIFHINVQNNVNAITARILTQI